jgi:hypothetical protein
MPRYARKQYAPLVARVPQALVDAVKRYASLHRCTVSELIREGLEMRLEAGEVPGRVAPARHTPDAEVIHEVIQKVILDVLPLLTVQLPDLIRLIAAEVIPEVIHHQALATRGNTKVIHEVIQGHTTTPEQTLKGHTKVIHSQDASALDYDPAKFSLGKLCPRGHDYQGTGHSLLRKHNQSCPQCLNALKREQRARRKAAEA